MRRLPDRYTSFIHDYPAVGEAYQALGGAVSECGPLDKRTQRLVKLSACIAAGLEGGTHSAVRKALDAGCKPEELRHCALMTLTTIGFPAMMKGFSWVEDVLSDAE